MRILMQFVKESDYYKELSNQIIKSSGLPESSFTTIYGYRNADIKLVGGQNTKTNLTINGEDINNFEKIFTYNVGPNPINLYLTNLIANYAVSNNIKVTNSQDLFTFRTGKILEKLLLSLNNIATPKFFFSNIVPTYIEITEHLGKKFVAKQSRSNFGKKVFLIENEEEYKKLEITQNSDDEGLWFFEEFIPHEFSTRGIVTGNTVNTAIKVLREKESFKTNHGEANFYKNDDAKLTEICVKAAQLMKLEFSGVDTVVSEGEILVLEINKSPGITIAPPSPEIQQIAEFLKL